MSHPLDLPLADVARALRSGDVAASDLVDEAIRRHETVGAELGAYAHFDAEGARKAAEAADRRFAEARRRGAGDHPGGGHDDGHDDGGAADPPPLCGIPVSVKDLYGVAGMPTYAGTARRLPASWEQDAWLVARLREQGAVFMGKTHTVELAYGAVGLNPHRGTPRNPRDMAVARIPGGSSSGAGVSLVEGSALVALGSDTGGSIRIPASLTGTVGHKTTKGLWPTDGVVPLSWTLDTVGALTRTAADALWFFDAVEGGGGGAGPSGGSPRGASHAARADADARSTVIRGAEDATPPHRTLRFGVPDAAGHAPRPLRFGVPDSALWLSAQPDVAAALHRALAALESAGWTRAATPGALIDDAGRHYFEGGIPGAECQAFLARDLPGWRDILAPIVAERLARVPPTSSASYGAAIEERRRMEAAAPALFDGVDVLVLPGALITPPPIAEVAGDLDRYVEVNRTLLAPTCPIGMLGLCAVTIPVGVDDAGMPVGLQLVGRGGEDRALLEAAVGAERVSGRRLP